MPTPSLVSGVDANLARSAALALEVIRRDGPQTRPALAATMGLGRTALTQRLTVLQEAGLVMEGEYGESTGGRNPRLLRSTPQPGSSLVSSSEPPRSRSVPRISPAMCWPSATQSRRSRPDLSSCFPGRRKCSGTCWPRQASWKRTSGRRRGTSRPVEYATGRPSEPPIMPGWDNYPVRERLTAAFQAPVWVDNDANVLALGELRSSRELRDQDFIYVKVGTGIGAGLVSTGQLHRGAQGSAGDIGHVAVAEAENLACRCGKYGCLEAIAGGGALGLQGLRAAQDGRSPILQRRFAKTGNITARDVTIAARSGDHVSVEALARSGKTIGSVLSTLVNFFNPSIILMGGSVVSSGGQLLASLRETVYQRSLPLATRDLVLRPAYLNSTREGGIIGAAHLALDELFDPATFQRLITHGPPRSVEELHTATVLTEARGIVHP